MCMSRGTLASMVAGQLVIYISGKSVLKHLSIIRELQLKAPANVLSHWEQAISLILFSNSSVYIYIYIYAMSPISRMWSAEKAVVGRQWRRNSWCGHNWVTGFVCNLHTTSPSHLSPSLLSPFCHGGDVAFVMGRGWQLSCTSVSLPLSQPSLLGKCLSLAQLQRSCSTARDTFLSPTVHAGGVHLKWLWQSFEWNWSVVVFDWF